MNIAVSFYHNVEQVNTIITTYSISKNTEHINFHTNHQWRILGGHLAKKIINFLLVKFDGNWAVSVRLQAELDMKKR